MFKEKELILNRVKKSDMKQSVKILLVTLIAVVIMAAGCSQNNRLTSPANEPMIDQLNSIVPEDGNIERITFQATLMRSEVEGGCLYLETDEGIHYSPYFAKGRPSFVIGSELIVSGYVDMNMNTICQIGDVFNVEKYKILKTVDVPLGNELAPDPEKKYINFTAIVHKTNKGVGCWYLRTLEGDFYTPLPPVGLELELFMELDVTGYVEWDILPFCGNGPAFRIMKYQIVSLRAPDTVFTKQRKSRRDFSGLTLPNYSQSSADEIMRQGDTDTAPVPTIKRDAQVSADLSITGSNLSDNGQLSDTNDAAGLDKNEPFTVIKGYYYQTDNGCEYISNEKGILAELEFQNDMHGIRDGSTVMVKGEFSALTWSPCGLGPLFYAESVKIIAEPSLPEQGDMIISL
jgi:hypothetical protein